MPWPERPAGPVPGDSARPAGGAAGGRWQSLYGPGGGDMYWFCFLHIPVSRGKQSVFQRRVLQQTKSDSLFIEDNQKRELTVYSSAVQRHQFCPAEVHGLKITCTPFTSCNLSC